MTIYSLGVLPFPIWNQSVVPCPVLTVASWPAYRFLKKQVRWSGIPISLRIFPVIYLEPNYGGGNEDNGNLLQKVPCMYCYTHCPQHCSRPPPTHASTGDSRTPTGKSRAISCGATALFFWVLVHKVLLCPPRVYFLSLFPSPV